MLGTDEKSCRFCLDSEPVSELIRPCSCRGTSAYVHRKCLDTWRATTRQINGFWQCTECHTPYRIREQGFDETAARNTYRLLMTRDIFLALLSVQLVIGAIALVAGLADSHSLHLYNMFHGKLSKASVYYLTGVVTLCFLIGLLGILFAIARVCCGGTQCDNVACCYIYGSPDCGRCDCCECRDCGGDCGNDSGALVFIAVVFVIIAATGFFIGVYFFLQWVKGLAERHGEILRNRTVTKNFVVIDLDKDNAQLSSPMPMPMSAGPVGVAAAAAPPPWAPPIPFYYYSPPAAADSRGELEPKHSDRARLAEDAAGHNDRTWNIWGSSMVPPYIECNGALDNSNAGEISMVTISPSHRGGAAGSNWEQLSNTGSTAGTNSPLLLSTEEPISHHHNSNSNSNSNSNATGAGAFDDHFSPSARSL